MEATSLAGYVKAVQQLVDEWTPKGVDWYVQPWFRGHGDASWSLEAGWHRSAPAARGLGAKFYDEAQLMETFKLRAPTYLERLPANDWEWLFLMQHYGLKTRLLDWTESSLIALYFALRDNADSDAAVWVMSPWWLNRESFGDYTLFPANDPRAMKHAPLGSGQKLAAELPIAITPIRGSQRIAAQRGVFTIHGTEVGALDRLARRRGTEEDPTCFRRILLPKEHLPRIRTEVALAGASESLVFPELAGLCREIKMEFFGE